MSKSEFDGREGDNLIFTNEGWMLPPITPAASVGLKRMAALEPRIAALEAKLKAIGAIVNEPDEPERGQG